MGKKRRRRHTESEPFGQDGYGKQSSHNVWVGVLVLVLLAVVGCVLYVMFGSDQ